MSGARTGVITLAVIGFAIVAACSNDNTGPSGPFSGSYTLDTLVVDTGPALFPPVATGTLQFGAQSAFGVTLILHPPATPKDSTIPITGTYKLSATDSITLTVFGVFDIHGTHAETGNKFVLNILVPPGFIGSDTVAAPVHLVWHR